MSTSLGELTAPLACKLCLGLFPPWDMSTVSQCRCVFCSECLKRYVELLITENLQTVITCPGSACLNHGQLQDSEIESIVCADVMQRYRRLQFEREVLLDPWRTWCPSSSCQAVCQLEETEVPTPQLLQCPACGLRFCSGCQADWHAGEVCQGSLPTMTSPSGENGSVDKTEEDEALIKRCPKCKVYIERDEGCAQMVCKNCRHAFCWYCLQSLDNDVLLIHYDHGPCRKKLGHSRASVIWHRTQVVGMFAGCGLLFLLASPFLLLALPFILCYKCNRNHRDGNL
ncbi:putative E3 ubiquitin-protein ligase RNF144A-B [Brachyhypopomus gauderio]|uniref:putative E3 ubiquitin-protein ligase RNF144A-B n=1 Tax=Brachyhypopomus gauderio TaxID=698409 RepID=UPI004042DC1C